MIEAAHRPTIVEIAKAAGVSTATVSYVLNNKEKINAKTRVRVNRAIQKLGYIPNADARRLRMRRSTKVRSIMFLSRRQHAYMTQPMFENDYLHGILDVTEKLRCSLVVGRVAEDLDVAAILAQSSVDGVIVHLSQQELAHVSAIHYPCVLLGVFIPNQRFHCVIPDNREGSRLAVRHLHALGHRSIGFISGGLEHPCYQERLKGYREAMAELGLAIEDRRIGFGGDLEAYFNYAPHPTAVVCSNDTTAKNVLGLLAGKGIAVPGRISVVGFDDIPLADDTRPPLTSIKVPRAAMSAAAARHLVDLVQGYATEPMSIVLPVTLHMRESTGPAMAVS